MKSLKSLLHLFLELKEKNEGKSNFVISLSNDVFESRAGSIKTVGSENSSRWSRQKQILSQGRRHYSWKGI